MGKATWRWAMCLASAAAILAGCQTGPMTLGPRGELVGFGPVISGRPTGYAARHSGLSDEEQELLAAGLAMPIKIGPGQFDRALVLEVTAEALRDGPSRLTLTLDPSLRDCYSLGGDVSMPGGPTDARTAIQLAVGADHLGCRVRGRQLIVSAEPQTVVAYYPVADLKERLGRNAEGCGPGEQFGGLLERTVSTGEPWESMGGRAMIDYVKDTLVISQTPEGHAAVAQRLAAIRLMAALTPTRTPR